MLSIIIAIQVHLMDLTLVVLKPTSKFNLMLTFLPICSYIVCMYVNIVWFIPNNFVSTHSNSHLRVPNSSQSITDIIGNVSGLVTNIIYAHCIISCINCIGHSSSKQ